MALFRNLEHLATALQTDGNTLQILATISDCKVACELVSKCPHTCDIRILNLWTHLRHCEGHMKMQTHG